jgi:hypothetical protein
MKLLSVSSDAKTIKGQKKGYLTGILYLLPADSSGLINVCASATEGCKASCLNTAGRGAFDSVQRGRLRKTRWLVEDRAGFIAALIGDVKRLQRRAARLGLVPCVRVNGTSDLPYLAHAVAEACPDVQLYDYSKHREPWKRTRPNYHLTFSLSESNKRYALAALEHGVNVSVVFDVKRGQPLPSTWEGYRVIDGDLTDLRFTDERRVVVGLRAKGKAKRDCSGFVQSSTQQLVQIAA